ncbi:MAG TPA: type II toxin-antitoxin system RelE/ParE family toxin [Paraburkholderia sp.]
MATFGVRFAPEAVEQLGNLERYIAETASPRLAADYVDAIVSYCESLQTFPNRGMRRDDVRPGLRVTNYRGRAVIAFVVEANQPTIIGVFYGGQDYETDLSADSGTRVPSFEDMS